MEGLVARADLYERLARLQGFLAGVARAKVSGQEGRVGRERVGGEPVRWHAQIRFLKGIWCCLVLLQPRALPPEPARPAHLARRRLLHPHQFEDNPAHSALRRGSTMKGCGSLVL